LNTVSVALFDAVGLEENPPALAIARLMICPACPLNA